MSTGSGTQQDFALSSGQQNHFETFGFLKLPGLFADEIDTIIEGFEEVFAEAEDAQWLSNRDPLHYTDDPEHAEQKRLILPFFVERSDKLRWLLDDPRLRGVVDSLLGPHTVYGQSDGNRFYCNVSWHPDIYGSPLEETNLKVYFYLDALDRDTGALRVIPGTNHYDVEFVERLRSELADRRAVEDRFGVPIDEIPSCTLEVQPGDLVVGSFRALHGSFGGAPGRRLFTMNFKQVAPSADRDADAAS
jgi:hypothetical protein